MRITIFNKLPEKAYSIPVCEGSTYQWRLMSEEFVQINFQSDKVLNLKKGYYADIEGLGRFEVVDLPTPEASTTADGYDYQLRLDRPWYKFKNRTHFFSRGTNSGMEKKWSLTDTLANHAAVVLDNLKKLGFTYKGEDYEVAISADIPSDTSKLVPFDGTSILQAITDIANAFEVEWWIDGKTIHFGKCELGDEVTMEVGKELAEPLQRQEDSEQHGTRLYAFGSTRNLNQNYRRELANPFTADGLHRIYGGKTLITTNKPASWYSATKRIKILTGQYAGKTVSFEVASGTYRNYGTMWNSVWANPVFQIDLGNLADTQGIFAGTQVQFIIGDGTSEQSDSSKATIQTVSRDSWYGFSFADIQLQQKAVTKNSTIASNGKETRLEYVGIVEDWQGNAINDSRPIFKRSDGTAVGSTVTIGKLAMSYVNRLYTKPIDGEADTAIQGIAEVALKLPKGTPYIDSEPGLDNDDVVDIIKQYEDIYPRALLTITSVTEVDAQTTDEDTGNVTYWKAYRFKAKLQDGTAYEFDSEYITADESKPLSIHFESGKLNGMDFEVAFNPEASSTDNQTFEIVRNDTYTLNLPNENAKPEVGDTLYMYNMDITFIDDALIAAAENELKEAAEKDMEKLRRDSGTYTGNTRPVDCEEKDIDLGYGQKVKLVAPEYFSAKDEHCRHSRVIGWSKNLEDPYDAEYTIGESAAYSSYGQLTAEVEEVVYYNGQIKNTNDRTISITAYERKIAELRNEMKLLKADLDTKLSRTLEDTARELITMAKGMTIGQYAAGKFGSGGHFDSNANAELNSLTLREFLEVPELRYNRISIQVGNSWRAPGGGIIEEVKPDTDEDGVVQSTGIIKLHLEDGEIGTIAENDICQGIYHDGMTLTNNDGADYDDSIGNFKFAGFYTCYFRIVEILEEGNQSTFRYALRPKSDTWTNQHHPTAAMHFVAYGNFTDKTRQTARYSTRTYERYLKDVDNWEFTPHNIGAQFGDLDNLNVFGLNMSGYSAYLNNIYMSGTIKQLQDLPPRLVIENSGDGFLAYGESCDISCTVMKGWTDITDTVTEWKITRDSADTYNDEAWNRSDKAQAFDGTITLSFTKEENDLGTNSLVMSTIFYIEAKGVDGEVMAQAQITI